mgnify:CR=1 FL=1
MPCNKVSIPGGGFAIVCSRGGRGRAAPCGEAGCAAPHVALCDFPMPGGGTCDRRMCDAHRKHVGKNRDHCPEHAGAHKVQSAAVAAAQRASSEADCTCFGGGNCARHG